MSKPMGRPGGRGPMSVNLDNAKDAKGTLKRVLNYLKSSKKLLILAVIFIILSVVFNLASTIILQPIIDNYIVPLLKNPESIEYKNGCIRMIVILVLIALSYAICTLIQYRLMIKVSRKTVLNIHILQRNRMRLKEYVKSIKVRKKIP